MDKVDINTIRKEFPILDQEIGGKPLVYFDNAATSQKPQSVIDALSSYYKTVNSNVHRGAHHLAEQATIQFEETREAARKFINAKSLGEVIFTKGTTEGINLVATSYGNAFLSEGDEIIISTMEHHSNIVPWQLLCERVGAVLKVIPINDAGELLMDEYEKLLSPKTKLVSVMHVSNVLGTVNPIKEIIDKAHAVGAVVIVDAAQSTPHFDVDVQELDCDFLVFSSHKIYGPTGMGILYGKEELLDKMPPYHGGGEMIKEVTFEKTTYNDLPHKFEAGTPDIGNTIALKAAFEFIDRIGKGNLAQHEHELLAYGEKALSAIPKLKFIGTSSTKVSVISFVVEGVHHYDLGMMLDANGVAIRTGHHCAQPLMKRFGVEGTARASFAIYNSKEEIDIFAKELGNVLDMLS